jgi:hypothetical protein
MEKRLTSKGRLEAAEQLANFIAAGGDPKEMMGRLHPEDAILVHDEAFSVLRGRGDYDYSIVRADADCLPFLMLCSPVFVAARRAMAGHLLRAFDAFCG